jgi:hypothetical protein
MSLKALWSPKATTAGSEAENQTEPGESPNKSKPLDQRRCALCEKAQLEFSLAKVGQQQTELYEQDGPSSNWCC